MELQCKFCGALFTGTSGQHQADCPINQPGTSDYFKAKYGFDKELEFTDNYKVPAGYYIEMCDCTCATRCPNGKVGSQYKCMILKKQELEAEDAS